MSIDGYTNPNLKDFWRDKEGNIIEARTRVLYGGRASSKSHEFATMIVMMSHYEKLLVLCTRAFQNKIKDSVKALIEEKINLLQLHPYFKILNTEIINLVTGSRFVFYGLSRNIQEIKSIEGVDICYIEEGQYITKEMYDILSPTIRKEKSEIWISFNPYNRTDFFYQKYIKNQHANNIVRKINYTENPFLSDTMLQNIDSYKDDEDFSHIFLGECKDDSNLSVISFRDLEACIGVLDLIKSYEPNFNLKDEVSLGFDVGDGGSDPNAFCVLHHFHVKHIEELKLKQDELEKAGKYAYKLSNKFHSKKIVYDSIGVGAGMGAIISMHSKGKAHTPKIERFIASNKPKSGKYKKMGKLTKLDNVKVFKNLKAQNWITLRDKVRLTAKFVRAKDIESLLSNLDNIISFERCSMTDKLIIELSTPRLVNKIEDMYQIESKESLSKRGIPSHNLADSIVMLCTPRNKSFS